ncbi:FRG domain protein [compost metagenome]
MGMVADFMTTFRNYTNLRPATAFDYYALMQHYGLPTRLLDWSSSPLVALFFALESTTNAKTRVIWAIEPDVMNSKSIAYDGVVMPNEFSSSSLDHYLPKYLRNNEIAVPTEPVGISLAFTNQRVTSQKGMFTLHGFNAEPIDEYYERNGLEQIAKIRLKSEEFRNNILHDLYAVGMKEDDVYQDLNSLTARIMREHGNWH